MMPFIYTQGDSSMKLKVSREEHSERKISFYEGGLSNEVPTRSQNNKLASTDNLKGRVMSISPLFS